MLDRILLVALTPLALAGGTATSWLQLQWGSKAGNMPAAQHAAIGTRPFARSAQLAINRGLDGMLHTRVKINGIAVDMVVDTGASRTILSETDALRIFGEVSGARKTTVRTIGGDLVLHLRDTDAVELGGKTYARLETGLINGAPVSVIGLDWLALLGPITIPGNI